MTAMTAITAMSAIPRLVRLPQTYVRVAAREYEYAAPSVGYVGRLDVDRAGAILHYPRLFSRVVMANR
jgi:hypothetical protein